MHSSIYGITLSGKSHFAKDTARAAGKRETRCVALDPMGSEWPDNVRVCTDWDADFLAALQELSEGGGGLVFVDEADIFLSQSARHNWWLVTRGRHFGFKVYVISQRPALVAPTVRTQCESVYMYRLSENDAKMIADECADKKVGETVPKLKQGTMAYAHWGATGERELDIYEMWNPVKQNKLNLSLDNKIKSA